MINPKEKQYRFAGWFMPALGLFLFALMIGVSFYIKSRHPISETEPPTPPKHDSIILNPDDIIILNQDTLYLNERIIIKYIKHGSS